MTNILRSVLAACLLTSGAAVVEAQQSTQKPATAQPPAPTAQAPQTKQPPAPATTPATQTPPQPAGPPAVPPVPQTATTPAARTFTAGCGLLMHPVRPERVQDFERFLDYVRDAMARTTNPRVQSQVAGWRFFKASEAGPNGVALYVFWVDPAIPGAEYALGPILAEVYTDPAQLAEIWALYTGSVTSGGTLLNLTPVVQRPPQPIAAPPANAPATAQKPAAPTPAPGPSVPTAPVTTGVAAPPRC